MRYISYSTGDLELRRTENIKGDKQYLEIVKWKKEEETKEYCYTILIFKETKEGYEIHSVGDRIVLEENEWKNLRILIKEGFRFLKRNNETN